MKILMTWEMDSDRVHLHHLRLIAESLRRRRSEVRIILASSQALDAKDTAWADEVFFASRLQFKHEHMACGLLANLSQLGWTAPDLRPWSFSYWSQLYREVSPDLVVAEASPGALLSAVLEDIPVIQTSSGPYLITQEDMVENDLFPEFQDWLWRLTGKSYGALMNKPGLVFSPSTLDVPRPGLLFHINPAQWPWIGALDEFEEEALIYAKPGSFNEIQQWLAAQGISSRQVGFHDQPCRVRRDQFICGAYDRFSVSQAAGSSSLYLGANPPERDMEWVMRCDLRKATYRAHSEDALAVLIASRKSKRAAERSFPPPFIDLDLALGYLTE